MVEQINNQTQSDQNIHVQNPPPPITPPTPDPIPDVKSNKKRSIVPFLIFIIVLLLGIVGVLSYMFIFNPLLEMTEDQAPKMEESTSTPTPNHIANWKEYTNEKYGYVFKCTNTSIHNIQVTDGDGQSIPLFQEVCSEDTNQLTIQVYSPNYIEGTIIGEPDEDPALEKDLKTSDGYIIKLRGWDEEYFNQILSTLKFIGSETNSNWQTHQGSIYQIQYPQQAQTHQYENTFSIYVWGPTQKEGTELYDGYSINISTAEMGMPLKNYIDSKIDEEYNGSITFISENPTPITINGLSGITYEISGYGSTKKYIFPDDEENLTIEVSVLVSDPENQNYQNTVDQILDTITFIDNL